MRQRLRRTVEEDANADAGTEHHGHPAEPAELGFLVIRAELDAAQEKAAEEAAETDSGEVMPQMMKATTNVAVLKKVTLSSVKALRWSSTPIPGTKPGCMLWG